MTDFKTIAEAIKTLLEAGLTIDASIDLLGKISPDLTTSPPLGAVNIVENSRISVADTVEHLGYRIVVLQRGWVAVGDVTRTGPDWRIDDARVIRVWGTTKGLGELADGPTSSSKVDDYGTIHAHELGVVLSLPVKAEKWAR